MPPDTDPDRGLEIVVGETSPETEEELVEGVRRFNDAILGESRSRSLAAVARDGDGTVAGGVAGHTNYQWFLIRVVWVRGDRRGSGLGRRLMLMAEAEAIRRGCVGAQVDTVSFQAPGFYRKLGYREIGIVEDFPVGHSRHFFAKRLGGQ